MVQPFFHLILKRFIITSKKLHQKIYIKKFIVTSHCYKSVLNSSSIMWCKYVNHHHQLFFDIERENIHYCVLFIVILLTLLNKPGYRTGPYGNLETGLNQSCLFQRGFQLIRPDEDWFPGLAKLREDFQGHTWIFGKTPNFKVGLGPSADSRLPKV